MPLKSVYQKSWLKGVIAVSNRFSLPKGSIPLMVNLLLNERGALQTCDGSALLSQIPTPPGPVIAQGQYTDPTSGIATKLAAVLVNPTLLRIYNTSANPATPLANSDLPLSNLWQQPQLIEFGGKLLVSLGNNVKPYVYDNLAAVPTQIGNIAAWQPNHLYYYGDMVTDTAGTHTFVNYGAVGGLQAVTATVLVPQQGTLGQPGGVSASVEPSWNVGAAGDGTADNVINWQYQGPSLVFKSLNRAPVGAAHLVSHAGALWAWNTYPIVSGDGQDGPNVLRQTQLNNPNSWPLINLDIIAPDDGDYGTGIGVFTIAEAGIAPNASLVLFKHFSGYQVTGLFNTPNFAIQKTKSDMGCVAGRTVQFATGYGILRLSHLGVALFDGVSDKIVSEYVRPYFFGFGPPGGPNGGLDWFNVQNCRSALCTSPPMYMLAIPLTSGDSNYYGIPGGDGSLIRVLCYDLTMDAWAVIDLPFKLSALDQVRLPTQSEPITQGGGFSDGVIRQLQNHDQSWDTGPDGSPEPIKWQAEFPTVGEPTARNYYHRVNIRGHATTPPSVSILPLLDANSPPTPSLATAGAAQPSASGVYGTNVMQVSTYEGDVDYVASVPVGQTASTLRTRVTGQGPGTVESVEVQLAPKPPRAAGAQV